jgi:hypothetical protein
LDDVERKQYLMNEIKIRPSTWVIGALLALAVLGLPSASPIAAGRGVGSPQPILAAAKAPSARVVIAGRYAGTVAIIEPQPLGELDLAFTLSDANGALSAAVDVKRTLVYAGAPALQGRITSSPGVVTPTFRLDSGVFDGMVSGRQVTRDFSLVGEVLNDGAVLQGQYEETIAGFTSQPLLVKAVFVVTRESGPPSGGDPPPPEHYVYLPMVVR